MYFTACPLLFWVCTCLLGLLHLTNALDLDFKRPLFAAPSGEPSIQVRGSRPLFAARTSVSSTASNLSSSSAMVSISIYSASITPSPLPVTSSMTTSVSQSLSKVNTSLGRPAFVNRRSSTQTLAHVIPTTLSSSQSAQSSSQLANATVAIRPGFSARSTSVHRTAPYPTNSESYAASSHGSPSQSRMLTGLLLTATTSARASISSILAASRSITSVNSSIKSQQASVTASSMQVPTRSSSALAWTSASALPDSAYIRGSEQCLSDAIADRTLVGSYTSTTENTVNGCALTCLKQGYQYAGTEYGSECFCGDDISARATNSSKCDYKCTGSAETCGGNGAISIVRLSSSYETIPESSPIGYLGCFQNVSALQDGLFGSRFMTNTLCRKYCGDLGYPYAATAYGVNCYCGTQISRQLRVANNCNQGCRGNSSDICGGNGVMSLWKLGDSFTMPVFPKPSTKAGQGFSGVAVNPFKPVSNLPPPAVFPLRDHPISPKGIPGGGLNPPVHTNKQYAQLFINSQTSAAFMEPYAFNFIETAFAVQNADYPEQYSQDQAHGIPEYIGGNLNLRQLLFSSQECVFGSCSFELSESKHASVRATLSGPSGSFHMPLVSGMGLVTVNYANSQPNITSASDILSAVSYSATLDNFTQKWLLTLSDNSKWLVYVIPDKQQASIVFHFRNNCLFTSSAWSGTIQAAKLPRHSDDVSLYDKYIGSWVTSMKLVGAVSQGSATYSFEYEVEGAATQAPLVFALPHHVMSMPSTENAVGIQLSSGMHGIASGFQSRVLTMLETNLPDDIGFLPDYDRANWSTETLFAIKKAITPDILGADFLGCNTYSTYFSGKCLTKSAQLCLVARDIVQDQELFENCLQQLKTVMNVFTSNKHNTAFNYDPVWKGIVADAGYSTPGADFGATDYNDHHFHYGYIIYAAAILAELDPTWAQQTSNHAFVESLIRDCANPSEDDASFPQFRSMDWFVGHSIAHGIATDFADGKDEESSSEDYNLAYAIQLYGKATGKIELQALGVLMGAVKCRSIQSYMLLGPTNTVQPPAYNMNYVSGILFANKMVHSTFFGGQTQFVHGIHMLPLTPMSPYVRTASFVGNEWRDVLSSLAKTLVDNWAGILYSNLAISDPDASWAFFSNGNINNFNYRFLDDGQTLTWALVFAAAQGGGGRGL